MNSTTTKRASGRFGALAHRQRVCWHNFADPKLQGNASPSNEPVWRCLDRARSGQFLLHHPPPNPYPEQETVVPQCPDPDAIAVLEFGGDGFVQQQIRRIVGTVLAISHGYLPEQFWDIATRPDVIVETPMAPEHRLYFAEARFHFEELRNQGRCWDLGGSLFQNALFWKDLEEGEVDDGGGGGEWTERLQCALLQRCAQERIRKKEEEWFVELRDVVTPRIRAQLEQIQQRDLQSSMEEEVEGESINVASAPMEYQRVLCLLRDIVATKQWPVTSAARSKVIRSTSSTSASTSTMDATSTKDGIQSGSFTVVNPKILLNNESPSKISFPKANELFPELVQAVFDLEESLSSQSNNASIRPPSSHCAINCNAEFTPHVDSGRGKGQSLSMIVGLGDYTGGELRVEESMNAIRYRPLEFDGWKQRHWTLPFRGERFSLVWFSPEL